MNKEPKDFHPKPEARRPLDPFDRKILGELVRDARQTYAEIGARVALSAPAVHERVKRLKAAGYVKGTSARLDGKAVVDMDTARRLFTLICVLHWGG